MPAEDSALPPDAIRRDVAGFSGGNYDLIIVGGGIYGVMLSLEGARRGLSCLLMERDDFGGHTSYNHLRILHGGLRYLQNLDLVRFRDSVGQRRWFLQHLPGLSRPLDCLLPLYGDGLLRPAVFRVALALDSLLAPDRNRQVPPANRLRSGRVLSAAQTKFLFPAVRQGVCGGAFWQDGFASDSPRLLIELLRWACAYGGRALNYCRAEGLLSAGGIVCGVRALDTLEGREYEFRSPVVVNAAGPWSRAFAAKVGQDRPELFPYGVLVWNLLFDRPALASCAVAVTPRGGGHTYFIPPWKGRLLVGTGHLPLPAGEYRPPAEAEIFAMIDDLNSAVPDLKLTKGELRRVFWGVMPGESSGQLASRTVFVDHGAAGGPSGFFSLSGIKFTTARGAAERVLTRLFPHRQPRPYDATFTPSPLHGQRGLGVAKGFFSSLQTLIREEAAMSLGDLVFRRTDLGDRPDLSFGDLRRLACLFPWEDSRQMQEVREVIKQLAVGLPVASDP